MLSPSSTNTPRGSVSQRKDNKETVSGNVTEHHAFCRALPQQSLRIVTLMFIQFVAEQLLCQHPPVFFFLLLFILRHGEQPVFHVLFVIKAVEKPEEAWRRLVTCCVAP